MRIGLRSCVAVATILTCFFVLQPAVAAEDWSPPQTLTPPDVRARNPQLLAAADGTQIAAWTGATGDIFSPRGLAVRTKPAGGTWGAQQILDPDASRGLDIALDGDDRFVATYKGSDEASVYALTQTAGGSFGAPVRLAPGLAGGAQEFEGGPFLAVGDRGQQAVIWMHRFPDRTRRVVAVRRASSDAAWSAPRFLATPGSQPVSLAVDAAPNGSIAVLWTAPRPERVMFRLLQVDGSWTPREVAARPDDLSGELQVANRGQVRITALWTQFDDQNQRNHAYTVSRNKAGDWNRIRPVGLRADRDELWHTLSTTGRLTVVIWSSLPPCCGSSHSRLIGRVQTGPTWGQPAPLSRPASRILYNGTAVNPDGSLRVVWLQNDGGEVTRILRTSGTWGPRTLIGHPGLGSYPPSVAAYGDRMAGVVNSGDVSSLGDPGGVTHTERTG